MGLRKKGTIDEGNNGSDNSGEQINLNDISERKIIYYINTSLEVDDIDEALEAIYAAKNADEWFESEQVYISYATIVLRIKSTRLEAFKNELKQIGELNNYSSTATDISIEYSATKEAIAAYEAEHSRLIELYENATVTEMIEINRRLSEVESKLSQLKRQQNEFDSLIEYRQVTIHIDGPSRTPDPSFKTLVKKAFFGGLNAFLSFLKYLVIAIIAILPFAIVIGGIFIIYKKLHKKKHLK